MSELIHGFHPVQEALRNPRRKFIRLLVTLNAARRIEAEAKAAGIAASIVHPKELDRLAGPDSVHQGLVLEAHPLPQPRLDEIERSGLVVLLDQVTDPHNIGAILRSCAAFGVTALVVTARHSPEWTGVAAKAASGAAEHVPFVRVTNLARAILELKEYGFRVLGLDSEAPVRISDVARADPLALVMGSEGKGLRQLTRQSCDIVVQLELTGPIRSLNVSNAAAIALYALSRP